VLVQLVSLVLAAACGDLMASERASPGTARPTPVEPATQAGDPPSEPPADAALPDGRHPVYLVDLDVAARTVTVDLIQFLTGAEADAAYREDTGDPDGAPNGYHIRNVSPRLRTLPVTLDVAVTVVRLGSPTGAGSLPWSLDQLPEHLAETPPPPEGPAGRLGWNPFWLTVRDGTVVAIDEQYLP
jgi:hypothetical protein